MNGATLSITLYSADGVIGWLCTVTWQSMGKEEVAAYLQEGQKQQNNINLPRTSW